RRPKANAVEPSSLCLCVSVSLCCLFWAIVNHRGTETQRHREREQQQWSGFKLVTTTQPEVGVFTTDANLIILVWDATLARLTRISEESASGRELTAVLPDLEQRGLLKRFQRSLEDGVVEVLAPAFHHYLIPCAPLIPGKHFDRMQQRVTIAPLRDDDT